MSSSALLEDLLSKDPQRIWSSSCAIRTLRDSAELQLLASRLEDIKAATLGVELGGALRPNSSHLRFAIKKLELVRSSRACLCTLYLEDDLYEPSREASAGNVRVTAKRETQYADEYDCECTLCAARYRAVSHEYHYTWWEWRPA